MSSRMRLIGSLFVLAIAALALALPGLASAKDRNHDKIPDKWEKKHDLSLKVKQTKRDQDKDGLKNRAEFKAETDPQDADSDNDGVEDGDESAGTISSYDTSTGVLTINLFNGTSVSGTVTESTEVKCDSGDDQGDEDGDSNDQGDDDQGDVGDDQGDDDQGDVGDDEGDHVGDVGDDDSEEGDDQHSCSVDHLVAGATVQEAELSLHDGGLVFEEIELAV